MEVLKKKSFLGKYATKANVAIVLCACLSSVAFAADPVVGPTAADFDGLKTAILTLLAGLGATAIAIMVVSQGWTIALSIAKKFFTKASS